MSTYMLSLLQRSSKDSIDDDMQCGLRWHAGDSISSPWLQRYIFRLDIWLLLTEQSKNESLVLNIGEAWRVDLCLYDQRHITFLVLLPVSADMTMI